MNWFGCFKDVGTRQTHVVVTRFAKDKMMVL